MSDQNDPEELKKENEGQKEPVREPEPVAEAGIGRKIVKGTVICALSGGVLLMVIGACPGQTMGVERQVHLRWEERRQEIEQVVRAMEDAPAKDREIAADEAQLPE